MNIPYIHLIPQGDLSPNMRVLAPSRQFQSVYEDSKDSKKKGGKGGRKNGMRRAISLSHLSNLGDESSGHEYEGVSGKEGSSIDNTGCKGAVMQDDDDDDEEEEEEEEEERRYQTSLGSSGESNDNDNEDDVEIDDNEDEGDGDEEEDEEEDNDDDEIYFSADEGDNDCFDYFRENGSSENSKSGGVITDNEQGRPSRRSSSFGSSLGRGLNFSIRGKKKNKDETGSGRIRSKTDIEEGRRSQKNNSTPNPLSPFLRGFGHMGGSSGFSGSKQDRDNTAGVNQIRSEMIKKSWKGITLRETPGFVPLSNIVLASIEVDERRIGRPKGRRFLYAFLQNPGLLPVGGNGNNQLQKKMDTDNSSNNHDSSSNGGSNDSICNDNSADNGDVRMCTLRTYKEWMKDMPRCKAFLKPFNYK